MTKAILWLFTIQVLIGWAIWTCACDMHVYDPALLGQATINVDLCGDEDAGLPDVTAKLTEEGVVWTAE